MDNKKIPTSLGTIIILIIALTVGWFVWKCEEKNDFGEIKIQKNNASQQVVVNEEQKQNISQEVESKNYSNRQIIGSGCYEIKDGKIDEVHLRNDFNNDPANSKVHYENKEFGVSFDVPYNKNWGDKDCKVLPYLEMSDLSKDYLAVDFGSYRAWMGGLYRFNIGKRRHVEDVIHEQNIAEGVPKPNPRIETIGKYKVVVYESYGMGTSRIYEVIGDKNNYVFEESQIGSTNGKNNPESSELKDVIKTLVVKD